jgi:UDP-N-acetylmuramate dehydrogenase
VSSGPALDRLARCLEGLGTLLRSEPMARHTTFGIGGPADLYFKAADAGALARAALAARRAEVPLFVLGSGSNILVGDNGIRGLVIENDARHLTEPQAGEDGTAVLRGESGASFASTARRLSRAGFWGLEWAVGIPGTLGGAVVYNAGAYGGCLADVLTSIDVLEPDGAMTTIAAAQLSLEYRGSVFTRGLLRDRVILGVQFRLRTGDPSEVAAVIAGLDQKRRATQPPGRNAGSIFKNPPEHPAWWLIDQVGLRGAREGDAEISEKHANFFSNRGHATAAQVRRLMETAKERVHARFGIELHPEVALVGDGF